MDPTDLGPGTATWLGGTGTVLLGGFLWLKRFLAKEATERAMDNADIGTVRRLNELLDTERTRANAAEARADQFAKERNELAAAVGRMEGKVEALSVRTHGHPSKFPTQNIDRRQARTLTVYTYSYSRQGLHYERHLSWPIVGRRRKAASLLLSRTGRSGDLGRGEIQRSRS